MQAIAFLSDFDTGVLRAAVERSFLQEQRKLYEEACLLADITPEAIDGDGLHSSLSFCEQ